MSVIERPTRLLRQDDLWLGQFDAMASPCEILMAHDDRALAQDLLQIAASEAWRIEQKYSRYRDDSVVARINDSGGESVTLDSESIQLLDFAYQCYELSDGLFDITSGVLRKVWGFDAGSSRPSQQSIDALMPLIGLPKARWKSPEFSLPSGMQIDFGGLGKEYAVDRTLGLLLAKTDAPLLVNFGGDIACNRCPGAQAPWKIGIENPGRQNQAQEVLEVRSGALATSGSSHRYLIAKGKRYGHVLNPKTGWPVEESPLSVTVAAATCTQAGMLATFSMLQGRLARQYLEQQQVEFWIVS